MNRTTGIVVAAIVLASIAPAPSLAADTGFYLSAGIGRAEEDPGKSNGANFSIGFPPAGVVHLEPERVDVDGGDTAWSVGMGYKFSQYFAAEVEYLDFGTTEIAEHYSLDVPPLPDEITLNYSSRITGSAISVLGSLPVGNGFEVYLRAGALYAHREFAVLLPVEAGSTTFSDTVWLGGAGVDWMFADRWAIRAEYLRSGDLDSTSESGETAAESVLLRVRYGF
jgi:opacity protein-like surface antigen